MIKESGYQEKIELVGPWLTTVIEEIKKDLKNEHLKVDREFCKRYFLGKGANMITVAEMAEAYIKDISEGNVGLGEFIASRWLLRHTDIYALFEEKLAQVNPDFDALSEIDDVMAQDLVKESTASFGATQTYLFALFNSVVFTDTLYEKLRESALIETEQKLENEQKEQVERSLEAMQKRHQRELAALSDRHEKKLSGMMKKYLNDTETLKKQIRTLQIKISDE